ncbi:27178_t:CDS:2, partial [Gigaspora margarita]
NSINCKVLDLMTPSRRKHCDGVKCWTTQSQINYTWCAMEIRNDIMQVNKKTEIEWLKKSLIDQHTEPINCVNGLKTLLSNDLITSDIVISFEKKKRIITKYKEEIAKNNYIIRQLNVQNENLKKDALKLRKENKTLKEENNVFKKEVANDYYLNQYEIAQNEIIELIQELEKLVKLDNKLE